MSPATKKLLHVRADVPPHWVGDGFHVRTLFSYDLGRAVSPFLLLDYAAPRAFPPSATDRRGVGEHPHRGFETVTIVYQGEVEHRDSAGHGGQVGPGDVQWMTAASGVVHEELHSRELTRAGGVVEMAQLWVNLPARDKLSAPRYQEIASARIPTVELPGGAGGARVIAGELLGARGPAETFTPLGVWDVRLAGGTVQLDVSDGHTALCAVLEGAVRVNGEGPVSGPALATFGRAGERVTLGSEGPAKILVLTGEPIDEPVVGRGPFVMNTEGEIRQALLDWERGALGRLA